MVSPPILLLIFIKKSYPFSLIRGLGVKIWSQTLHPPNLGRFPKTVPQMTTIRVQDYLDSETRYRNDVIVSLRFG